MSDEHPNSPVSGIPEGIVEHWCEREGCSKWGGHGFSRGKNQPNVWFCAEHREDGERYLGKA
nr:hypothetical protein [Chelativorans oligotrophicus]